MAQPSPVTFSYRILLKDFKPEQVIATRQEARGQMRIGVYAVEKGEIDERTVESRYQDAV